MIYLSKSIPFFDQMSQSGVQRLSLIGGPSLWSVPLYFPQLVSLDAENLQLTTQGLISLSGHPSLRELRIRTSASIDSDNQVGLMNTSSLIIKICLKRNLRRGVGSEAVSIVGSCLLHSEVLLPFDSLYRFRCHKIEQNQVKDGSQSSNVP